MTANELIERIDNFNHISNKFELLEFICILKAWETLSSLNIIEEENLSYYTFDNKLKYEIEEIIEVFKKLSKEIKLFELYKLDNLEVDKLDSMTLYLLFEIVNNAKRFPKINDLFFFSKYKIDSPLFTNQIAELGVKLLDTRTKNVDLLENDFLNYHLYEVYVPFTQGFAYANYMFGKIYTDAKINKYAFIAELINVCEPQKQIRFELSNALENPVFLDENDKNKLREFRYVLSFPPYSLKQNIDIRSDKYHRFHFQKGAILDIAHFEHILAQTEYKAVVLMPVGFTYRSGNEELFRKYLIDKNYLEGIIQLPPSLHGATSIETTFFIINKYRNEHRIKQNDVMFINLKDESFIKREGRQLVFKSVNEIRDIYIDKKELKNISALISLEEIIENNYSFAIDRYITTEETRGIQKDLEKFELIKLEDIADVRKSQLLKDEEQGLEINELSPSDFSKAGFTLECGKIKKIGSQENRLDTYKLEPYDVLLSTKGTIGKVAIIGEIKKPMIASQAIQVIRFKENKKGNAISLYMFLKSNMGQTILSSLTTGTAMPQISTVEIKNLGIPKFTDDNHKTLFLNFNREIEISNKIINLNQEIQQIHNNFLGND